MKLSRTVVLVFAVFALPCVLAANPPAPPGPPAAPPPPAPAPAPTQTLSAKAALGQQIFFDANLSASGNLSCASCHSPAQAYTLPGNHPTALGGVNGNLQGPRNPPTVMYSQYTPGFSLNGAVAAAGQTAVTSVAAGGFFRDGRAASLAAQAQLPLTTTFEMANANSAAVLAKLKTRPYLNAFTAIYGTSVLNNADSTLAAVGDAIAAFETEALQFKPFSSKYDAFVAGKATLTVAEANGLAAFNSPTKGNCAACHSSQASQGVPAQFTDHGYRNLGVPRNWQIAYNNDQTILPSYIPANGTALGAPNHKYYDLGLCGPFRTDLASLTSHCGQFKTPTLRNVAVKQTYFHNGVFSDLNTVLAFYATRTANPARWYQKPNGTPDIVFNDLPVIWQANVVTNIAPLSPITNHNPTITPTDAQNLVSFLCTLTDGYDPNNPTAYALPAQCKGI